MKAVLLLQDGTVFEGRAFGASGEICGEVVFNTSMSGYQEILTDPSYHEQIVTMTYPLIGNYGANPEDYESKKARVSGFIVKEYCPYPSNFRSRQKLAEFLKRYGIIGIEGIDTRMLVKLLRTRGAQNGILSTVRTEPRELKKRLDRYPGLVGRDIVKKVTAKKPYGWPMAKGVKRPFRVVAFDFGIKYNILRLLSEHGCRVTVVPANTTATAVLAKKPNGIFLSNGPGDPAPVSYAVKTIRALLGKVPVFGICLGHQLLGLAMGGSTYKLKFGHRGANHPVKNLKTGKIEITPQNHGFCVDMDSLKGRGVEVTHMNLNDNTVEGIRCKKVPAFSVQYHPEASPGPHDSNYLFREFIDLMRRSR